MEIDHGNTFQLLHPFSMSISGITQSGKTQFLKSLLLNSNKIVTPAPDRVVICFTEEQEAYRELVSKLPHVELIKGLEFDLEEFNPDINNIIVIDDQMNDAVQSEKIHQLLTKGSHHKSVSVIILTQNLFPQGKHGKTMRLNTHYTVIMKSPTFASQINYLSRQVFPNKSRFLPDAYKKATKNPYSYLVLNLHPRCDDQYRVIQGILGETDKFVYLPK